MRAILHLSLLSFLFIALVAGCQGESFGTDAGSSTDEPRRPPIRRTSSPDSAIATAGGYESISPEELERGRRDDSWKRTLGADSAASSPAPSAPADTTEERWDDIAAKSLNEGRPAFPVGGEAEGPSVLRVQILLDRMGFSPGILDGKWGKNTEKAVYWMQKREGLSATGQVDSATFARLRTLAAAPTRYVVSHTLTEEEAGGPFTDIPDDIYEKAKLDRLGYTSLLELLSEQFHATPELLQQLNPEVSFDGLAAGTSVMVPNVQNVAKERGVIDRIVISDGGHYLHAVDSTGRVLYHFPSTLGSSYDPSPQGEYKVTSITEDPWWHYQPSLLAHVPDDQPDARIPPGPNNAVGRVWMALSKPHYGIHGTSAPETIGYATSAGCIRLTNWDALFLSHHIDAGTPVVFRDTGGEA